MTKEKDKSYSKEEALRYHTFKEGNYMIYNFSQKRCLCKIIEKEKNTKEDYIFKIKILGEPDFFKEGSDTRSGIFKEDLDGMVIPDSFFKAEYLEIFLPNIILEEALQRLRYFHCCQNEYPDYFNEEVLEKIEKKVLKNKELITNTY